MANKRPVASLWIGERLQYLNQICLKSHVDQGHPTTLYCTHNVQNLPEGVEMRPASDIMDVDLELVEATSASFFSNVFRYKMIQATGAIWVDCDAFCYRPFPDDMDYIFAGHGMIGNLNCGVVAIPQDCSLMDQLLQYYEELPDYPPWWRKNQRNKMDKLAKEPGSHASKIYKVERTAFGPQAFTHFAKATGDFEKAMAPEVLYPVPFQLNDIFYDPHGRVEGWFTERTLSVHLYTNGTKPYWRRNPPLENSFADRMSKKIGIDPSLALDS